MKRILVTTLLLSCMTLVGCNPITMKITTSDDLSNINVEVDGFSMENITMQPDGSVNVNLDGMTQNQNSAGAVQGPTMQNASMQTPEVLGSYTQNSNGAQNTVAQNTVAQNSVAQNTVPQDTTSNNKPENTTTQNVVAQDTTTQNTATTDTNVTNNQTTTDDTTKETVVETTQEQKKDSYGIFKDIVSNHLTAYDNIHSIGLNPETVDFTFIESLNNDWTRIENADLIKQDAGKVFLVICYDEMSADYVVDVYEVSGNEPVFCGKTGRLRGFGSRSWWNR